MNIGITCYPTYGGSGVVATELGKALAEKGHSVHFISYALPMRLTGFMDNVLFHEVETSNYPLFDFPLYTLSLASKMVEVAKYKNSISSIVITQSLMPRACTLQRKCWLHPPSR